MNSLTIRSGSQTNYVPHLLTSSPSDVGEKETETSYATQLLAIPNDEVCKGNISLQLLEAWSDNIKSGIANEKFKIVCQNDSSLYKPLLALALPRDLVLPNQESMTILEVITQALSLEGALDGPNPNRRENAVTLLHQLNKALYIQEKNHPVRLVLYKFIDAIIERLALDKKVQEKFHFSMPVTNANVFSTRSLLCFKTFHGWRCGDFSSYIEEPCKVVEVNTHKGQTLLIDKEKNFIQHPAIIISANIISEADPFRKMTIAINFLFHSGSIDVSESQKNSFTIRADIDLHKKNPILQNKRQDNFLSVNANRSVVIEINEISLNEQYQRKSFEQIEKIFPFFKDEIIKQCKESVSKSILISLFPPQSQSDKVLIIYKLLTELSKKDANQHVAEISYIAEKLNPTFSEKEITLLIKNGDARKTGVDTLEVTPKAILDKLCSEIKEKRAESVRAALAKTEKKKEILSDTHKEKEFSSTTEETEKSRQLEKTAEKERKRQLYQWEQFKLEKKASAFEPVEEEPESKFDLSSGEQAAIDSIYEGNPLKAKEFTALAAGLLQKKATGMEATPSMKRKGSHIKFHLKKEERSSGVTFVVQHKKKDHKGSLKAQRDTLDDIFSLK
jgi:hypothetical protein